MKLTAVIPARLASSRFPRKILYEFYGLPMIEHVRRRALLSKLISDVYVATCDQEIADTVNNFGGKVIMTADTHSNGTTRVAEAASEIDCSHVILIQGDEPLLLPRHIDIFSNEILNNPDFDAWNVTGPIEDESELDKHSFVKCSVSPSNKILYCFRRSPCYGDFDKINFFVLKMLGIIAYRKDFLEHIARLPESIIEQTECIEQMRILENGYHLQSVLVDSSLPSVNEPEDANIVLDYIQKFDEQKKLVKQIL